MVNIVYLCKRETFASVAKYCAGPEYFGDI